MGWARFPMGGRCNYNWQTMLVTCLAMTAAVAAYGGAWSGNVTGEARLFPNSPLYPEQHGHNLSLALQAQYHHEWPDRKEHFIVEPFLRLDQHDHRRTHGDIRELYWHKITSQWELRLGFRREFWGVAESQNLVDIINQRDVVEGLGSDAKLGQLMLNFTWIQNWGTLDFYVLPLFRERTFAGRTGRFRTPVPMDFNNVRYESGAREWHPDLAIRYKHYIGNLDIGLSHFSGTSREPRYLARALGVSISPGSPLANLTGARIDSPYIRLLQRLPGARLIPFYDQIEQTGVDLQYILAGWVFRFEGIHRSGMGRTYTAMTAGVEYAFYSIFKSALDASVILEYMWDSRRRHALTSFENDFFIGSRIAFNDVQGTSMLGGMIIDADSGAMAVGIEASRRLADDWRIRVEARMFANVPPDDIMTTVRKDDYIQAELTWFF